MILSFHPIIEADENIICAGREPNDEDLAAIQRADAVILHQGCFETLYRMARMNCPHVFPNLDARFDYPGKCSQLRLFRNLGLPHPNAQVFSCVDEFHRSPLRINFPSVVKLDWGGQGETVFKVDNPGALSAVLDRVATFERSGLFGFLIQRFVPNRCRSLRVAQIHTQFISYWRIQTPHDDMRTSVAQGARIDHDVNAEVTTAVQKVINTVCRHTGLQLAGFDFIFDSGAWEKGLINPLILEINYFFGRTGIGGSEAYYRLLQQEIDKWLARLALSR